METVMTMNMTELDAAFDVALTGARLRYRAGDLRTSFTLLERAHVLGQRQLVRHLYVHAQMLRVGWALRDWREVRGQLSRLLLTPIGHLTGRLPMGNTGGANVSAFAPMPIPEELRAVLDAKTAVPDDTAAHPATSLRHRQARQCDAPQRSRKPAMGLPSGSNNSSADSIEPKRSQKRRNVRTASLLLLIVLASLTLFLNHVGIFDGKGHRHPVQVR